MRKLFLSLFLLVLFSVPVFSMDFGIVKVGDDLNANKRICLNGLCISNWNAGGQGASVYTGVGQVNVDNDANTISVTQYIASEAQIDANATQLLNSRLASIFPLSSDTNSPFILSADTNNGGRIFYTTIADFNSHVNQLIGGTGITWGNIDAIIPWQDVNVANDITVQSSGFVWDSNSVLDGRYAKITDVNGQFVLISDTNNNGRITTGAIRDLNSLIASLAGSGSSTWLTQTQFDANANRWRTGIYPIGDTNIANDITVQSSGFIYDSNAVLDSRYAKTTDVNGQFILISDTNNNGRLTTGAIKDLNSLITTVAGSGGGDVTWSSLDSIIPWVDANVANDLTINSSNNGIFQFDLNVNRNLYVDIIQNDFESSAKKQIFMSDGILSSDDVNVFDWDSGLLLAYDATQSLDWDNRQTTTSAEEPSIDWENRTLRDIAETGTVLNWATQTLSEAWTANENFTSLADLNGLRLCISGDCIDAWADVNTGGGSSGYIPTEANIDGNFNNSLSGRVPWQDANVADDITVSNYVRNAIFNSFYPIADANITSVSSSKFVWDSNAVLDGRYVLVSDSNDEARLFYTSIADFNEHVNQLVTGGTGDVTWSALDSIIPWADANVANDITASNYTLSSIFNAAFPVADANVDNDISVQSSGFIWDSNSVLDSRYNLTSDTNNSGRLFYTSIADFNEHVNQLVTGGTGNVTWAALDSIIPWVDANVANDITVNSSNQITAPSIVLNSEILVGVDTRTIDITGGGAELAATAGVLTLRSGNGSVAIQASSGANGLIPTSAKAYRLGVPGNEWGDFFLGGSIYQSDQAEDSAFSGDVNFLGAVHAITLSSFDANSLALQTSATNRVMILSDGNVGVRTNTPRNALNVIGDVNATGTYYGDGSNLTGIPSDSNRNTNAVLAASVPWADTNISSAASWNARVQNSVFNAAFPVSDLNITGTTYTKNAIFNAFYPVADANITAISSSKFVWDSNGVLDGRYAKITDVNGQFVLVSDTNNNGRIAYTTIADFNTHVNQLIGGTGITWANLAAVIPWADANVANDITVSNYTRNAIFNATFPLSDTNITGTTYTKNAIFNAFYPIADANITSASTWNSQVQNTIFNAAYPWQDANVANNLTIQSSNDANFYNGLTSNRVFSTDNNTLRLGTNNIEIITLGTDGDLNISGTFSNNVYVGMNVRSDIASTDGGGAFVNLTSNALIPLLLIGGTREANGLDALGDAWTGGLSTYGQVIGEAGLQLGTSGGAQATLLTDGNLGIGTTTPHNKLNVIGDINTTGKLLLPTGAQLCSGTDTNCFFPNAGGGGGDAGTPGGSDTQLQYNNGGAFGGTSGVTWNDATNDLNISTGANTGISVNADSNRICFPANTCEMSIDYNGTAFVFGA